MPAIISTSNSRPEKPRQNLVSAAEIKIRSHGRANLYKQIKVRDGLNR